VARHRSPVGQHEGIQGFGDVRLDLRQRAARQRVPTLCGRL
jgi:hypothetical protein